MNTKISVSAFEIIQIDTGDSAIREREIIHHIPWPSAQQATRFILQEYTSMRSMLWLWLWMHGWVFYRNYWSHSQWMSMAGIHVLSWIRYSPPPQRQRQMRTWWQLLTDSVCMSAYRRWRRGTIETSVPAYRNRFSGHRRTHPNDTAIERALAVAALQSVSLLYFPVLQSLSNVWPLHRRECYVGPARTDLAHPTECRCHWCAPVQTRPCRWMCSANRQKWQYADRRRRQPRPAIDRKHSLALVCVRSGTFHSQRPARLATCNRNNRDGCRWTRSIRWALYWLRSMAWRRYCGYGVAESPTFDHRTSWGNHYGHSSTAVHCREYSADQFWRNVWRLCGGRRSDWRHGRNRSPAYSVLCRIVHAPECRGTQESPRRNYAENDRCATNFRRGPAANFAHVPVPIERWNTIQVESVSTTMCYNWTNHIIHTMACRRFHHIHDPKFIQAHSPTDFNSRKIFWVC